MERSVGAGGDSGTGTWGRVVEVDPGVRKVLGYTSKSEEDVPLPLLLLKKIFCFFVSNIYLRRASSPVDGSGQVVRLGVVPPPSGPRGTSGRGATFFCVSSELWGCRRGRSVGSKLKSFTRPR